jgi:hypothetical protein
VINQFVNELKKGQQMFKIKYILEFTSQAKLEICISVMFPMQNICMHCLSHFYQHCVSNASNSPVVLIIIIINGLLYVSIHNEITNLKVSTLLRIDHPKM